MKKIIYCSILLLCSFGTHAQLSQKLDSLKKVLAKLPKEGSSFAGDTSRVRVLCEMGEEENFEKSEISLNRAISISKKNNWIRGEMSAYHNLGIKNSINGNLFKAIDNLNISLAFSVKLRDSIMIGNNLRYIGDSYLRLKAYKKAIESYRKAEKIFYNINESYGRLISINNLSIVYKEMKNYSESLKLLYKCKKLNTKNANKNLFDLFIYNNIADNYFFLNSLDSALFYFNKAAFHYQNVLNKTEQKKYYIAVINFGIAQIYFKKNNFEGAIYLSNQSLKFNNTDKVLISKVYKQLSEIYEAKRIYKKSLLYQRKYQTLKDSVENLDFDRKLKLINSEYDFEKEKIYATNLRKEIVIEKRIKQNLWISLGLFVIFVLIILALNLLLRRKNNEIKKVTGKLEFLNNSLEEQVINRTKELTSANAELLTKNKEIIEALFKGQSTERKRVASELHDNLGSTLSALKWRLEALDSQKLSEKERKIYDSIVSMMKNAYSDVRHISHNMLPIEFEENGLIGAIEKLIDDINYSEKIKIEFKNNLTKNELDKNIELEIYSICLEIMNNILKHSKATKVSIMINYDEYLSIKIEDNGIGFDDSTIQNGVGIKNINERVKSINGSLKLQSEINVGTQYNIDVPLEVSNN